MSSDYTTYLAASVLNDGKAVTYRTLSRALKVHGNSAKKMLYEFHQCQNAKKKGSVHATYLVTGIQVIKPSSQANGTKVESSEDVSFQSSPYMSSSIPQQEEETEEAPEKITVVSLVKEERLQETKAQYEGVSSVHIFSLQPSSIQNLQILSDNTRQMLVAYIGEDPLVHGKQYGIIQNPLTKRRAGARPVVQAPPSIPKTKPVPMSMDSKKSTASSASTSVAGSQTKIKSEAKAEPKTKKVPAIKREKSDIFKSFAKAKPKLVKEESNSATNTPAASQTDQDVSMKDASDDDEVDEDEQFKVQPKDQQRKSKAEREEQLRKLMEEDDNEDGDVSMDDAPANEEPVPDPEPEPVEDVPSREETPPTTVTNGRRRGKRRIMKKKTTKDAEGYLVTKEEAVWESFSEDESVPAPKAKAPLPAPAAKGKKSSAKPGQGNIMSFFGKK